MWVVNDALGFPGGALMLVFALDLMGRNEVAAWLFVLTGGTLMLPTVWQLGRLLTWSTRGRLAKRSSRGPPGTVA